MFIRAGVRAQAGAVGQGWQRQTFPCHQRHVPGRTVYLKLGAHGVGGDDVMIIVGGIAGAGVGGGIGNPAGQGDDVGESVGVFGGQDRVGDIGGVRIEDAEIPASGRQRHGGRSGEDEDILVVGARIETAVVEVREGGKRRVGTSHEIQVAAQVDHAHAVGVVDRAVASDDTS